MKIYMDLCCFNRPFDDQLSNLVYLETEAKLFIQTMIKSGMYKLLWSYMLDYENSANPDIEARDSIALWKTLAVNTAIATPSIISNTNLFKKEGLGIKDAIHLACALESKADFFITVDKGILKKQHLVPNLKVLNPINFIELEE